MIGFLRQFWLYITVAALLHAALVVFLVVNLDRSVLVLPDDAVPEAIDATVVDEALVTQQLERIQETERRRQQELEDARQAAERAAQQRAAEERRIQELQAQREREQREAQAQRERQAREAAERQRQEQQRAEQVRREREAEERRLAEIQRQREAEAARQREAEAERERQAEAQRRAAAEAEERRRQEARRAELLQQYTAAIRAAVERTWIRPEAWPAGTSCTVRVSQIPGGEVVEARVTQSCGSPTLDRSVENAVLRASPLPRPPDPSVFAREIEFVFAPRN